MFAVAVFSAHMWVLFVVKVTKHEIIQKCMIFEINFFLFLLPEYEAWKSREEASTMSHFVCSSGPKHRKDGLVKKYLACHRSGSYEMKPDPVRAHKRKGSVKCNKHCFATMSVSIKADKVTVKYQAEHYGHEKEACFQPLSIAQVQQVKAKLELGVPPKSLVAEVKAGATGKGITEEHLLDLKKIRNIRTKFNIGFNEKRDADDFISLGIWIDELQKNSEEPLVLYADKDDLNLKGMKTFQMALMSPLQKDLLLEYGQDVICIDSTHGTTAHDLQLTTLMVRGSNGSGIPCAYLLSRSVSEEPLKRFFEAIKSRIGKPLNCRAFMSDAANAYYNAWNAVMGTPEKRLLCIWHVRRNWTAQLKKQISSSDKRKDLSQKLETLMSSKNEQDFATMLKHILDHGADPDLADFVQYFKSQYAGNPELWGYCFREGIHLNTNNYLESMHNELKTNYLGGKHNARLDKLLYVLVQLTRDRLMKLVLSKVNPKADCKSSANFKRHREALKIHSAKDVSQLCEGEWVVGAQTHVRDQYTVCLLGECTGCYLSCQYCCACLHKFKCSCLDFRMHNCVCKHIHAVALWQVNQKSLSLDENSDKAIPSTSASNQPLLDPENNDDLAVS